MKKTDLVEIKKNNIGTGLLIEQDGYASLPKSVIKEHMSSEDWHVPYPFVVDAVFQKYGVKNANGRIYPKEVLMSQVEKYQDLIRQHLALGECYTPDVLILTECGWKQLSDVTIGENILTLNTDTNEIEIKPILRKIEKDYDGDLIHLYNSNIDDTVTPKHEFILYQDDKFAKRLTAQEISENTDLSLSIPSFNSNDSKTIINLSLNELKCEKVAYKGKVMCVEVENHSWYVMSNGKCHWTSNCNHPDSSTIDLGRVSHNIIELHWEGCTLVGKLELNLSQGFVKHGICSTLGDTVANLLLNGYKIGVSSRGVGSVEQKMGQYVVGTDFDLICWDIVSSPSTPNAYIGSREELEQYIESENKQGTLVNESNDTVKEKISQIRNILNS